MNTADTQLLEAFCNRVLELSLHGKWEEDLVTPVHKNTAVFARLYVEGADRSAIEAAATELEASLNLCGTTHLQTLADIANLVEDLYDLVEAY